jgi:hypothetical protein
MTTPTLSPATYRVLRRLKRRAHVAPAELDALPPAEGRHVRALMTARAEAQIASLDAAITEAEARIAAGRVAHDDLAAADATIANGRARRDDLSAALAHLRDLERDEAGG